MVVQRGRRSAAPGADGTVLFLIGMRINRFWQFWRWFPVFAAMPRMLRELARQPELGLASRPRTYLSGRVILTVQYWTSLEQLLAYARAADHEHLPAWRAFNRRVRDNGSVGIFHEPYLVREDGVETMYGNMPTFGLATALGATPTATRGNSARARLVGSDPEPLPVDPY